jgi:hypothetical protein
MSGTFLRRLAMNMKKALPTPVPKSTVALMM